MKQISYTLVIIILTALAVVFFMRGCDKPAPYASKVNTDSIAKSGYSQGYEIAKLEEMGKVKDSIQTRYVTKWKEYKAIHDTVEVVKECIANCDSALNTQSEYICHLETLSSKKDTLITTWRTAYQGDSTNFAGYRDSVNKVPSKFWKGFKWGFGIGNITGAAAMNAIKR